MSGSERAPVRERILRTASEMFYRDGIRAVGVDAIIAASGVAKMSLYRNFPSKDDLVVAWLEDRNRAFFRRWSRAIDAKPGDPRGQLEAILDAVAAHIASPSWRGCPFLNTATEFPGDAHPARRVILDNKRAVHATLEGLAREAGARDPALLADELQVLIDGAYVTAQSLGPGGPARTVASAGRALIAAQLGE